MSGYDYSSPGHYHVVICTKNREKYFGEIINDAFIYKIYGIIAYYYLIQIPFHYKNIKIDTFQIMPNHIHMLIEILDNTSSYVGTAQCAVPTYGKYGLLSKIIKIFKEMITKHIRNIYNDFDFSWQRSFWDTIIETDDQLFNTREYVKNNPNTWELDRNNKYSRK